jgi:hypothetical protein
MSGEPDQVGTDREDPVVRRRHQVATAVRVIKQIGYALLLASVIGFVLGALTDFEEWTVSLTVFGLVGACIVLPIPIVLGYAVAKAEREDPLR